ncbi:MAG: MFS transporter, partial [Opitutales bacterium]
MSQSKPALLWSPEFPVAPKRFPFFYGWVIVALSTLGICASMPGQTIGVSVFTTRLSEALGLSILQLSIAYMIGTLLSAVWLNRGGRFFDEAGARKSIVLSFVSLGVVLIGLSFVERISQLITGLVSWDSLEGWVPFLIITLGFGLLRFTGQGMVTLSSRAMVGKWFDKRRGAVTAVSGAVVSFFYSGSPIMMEQLIVQFTWQGAWQVMGLFMLLGMAVIFWMLARDNPEECGLLMDGGVSGKPRKENLDAVIKRDFTKGEAEKTFAFWAFTLCFGLQSLMVTAYTFHVIELGAELGLSREYILGLFVPTAGV